MRPVERDTAGEGLADHLVGHRHVGNENGDPVAFVGAAFDSEVAAQRHEFGIFLAVGDEIEHFDRAVADAALGGEGWHPLCVIGRARL